MKFVYQPVAIRERAVTVQMYVDSPTRPRAFAGILSFTIDEFITFKEVLEKGVSGKNPLAELIIHPMLDAIEDI